MILGDIIANKDRNKLFMTIPKLITLSYLKEIDNKNKNVSATSARYYNHGVDWADNDTAISRS